MDYDDTLTPQVPIEQPPDADSLETQVATNQVVNSAATPSSQVSSTAEPDLELLAVLLKNPELVFALTSGQAGNLSSEETVTLLDMIKAGGAGLVGSFNSGRVEEKVEVSLPSPTPSSNSGTVCQSGSCSNFWQISHVINNYCKISKGDTICSQLCQYHCEQIVLPLVKASIRPIMK